MADIHTAVWAWGNSSTSDGTVIEKDIMGKKIKILATTCFYEVLESTKRNLKKILY